MPTVRTLACDHLGLMLLISGRNDTETVYMLACMQTCYIRVSLLAARTHARVLAHYKCTRRRHTREHA